MSKEIFKQWLNNVSETEYAELKAIENNDEEIKEQINSFDDTSENVRKR